jgi:hypothetical protein
MQLLRAAIDNQLELIPRQPHLNGTQILSLAQKYGAKDLTLNKLYYMVSCGLITPHVVQREGRNIYLYGRDQLCKVILIDQLRHIEKLSYTQIASLFHDDQLVSQATARMRQSFGVDNKNIAPSVSSPQPMLTVSKEAHALRIFLCHASNDKPAVRELYRRLREDGFAPWLDEENLFPGQDWQQEIPKAVRQSDIVIVCLSRNSITKAGYVQKEIKFALDVADEQPDGMIFLIPLKLEECDVPERLSRWHWVDQFDANGYTRLMRSLHHRAESLGLSASHVTATGPVVSQPPTKDVASSSTLNVSGGVNVGANSVTVGNDVASDMSGRKAGAADARTIHIQELSDLAENILNLANESLIENQETLIPFLQHPENRSLTRDALVSLFEKQRHRGLNRQRLTLLEEYRVRETEPEIKDVLTTLHYALSSLYETFYSHDGKDPRFYKRTLAEIFEKVDTVESVHRLTQDCEAYLEHLRHLIEDMAICSARLRALLLT